jgi:hypothetical protein
VIDRLRQHLIDIWAVVQGRLELIGQQEEDVMVKTVMMGSSSQQAENLGTISD